MSPYFKSFLKGLLNKVKFLFWSKLLLLVDDICELILEGASMFVYYDAKQVSQSRLTWPALLEHPFIKESLEEVEARVTI